MANSYSNKVDYISTYNKTNYDNLQIRVKKGMKDHYKKIAASMGMSLAALCVAALDEYIERHKESTRIT